MAEADDTVELFTDGACSGNPGPGGWGAILRWRGHEKELSGGAPALVAAQEDRPVSIITKADLLEFVAHQRRSSR